MNAALVIKQQALREHFFYQNGQLLLEHVELPESIVRPRRLIFSPITPHFCATLWRWRASVAHPPDAKWPVAPCYAFVND